jgi:hypothetical protein
MGVIISDLDTTFIWHAVTGATNYEFEISKNADFSGSTTITTASTSTGNIAITTGDFNTVFYWHVRAYVNSAWGGYSEVWHLTTGLVGPTLLSPANHSTVSTKPTLSWNLVPGSLGYHLIVSEYSDWSLPVYNSDLAANTYSFATSLNNNKKYYWRVYATNVGGNSGWSETWDFTTSVAIPNLHSPSNLAVLDNTTPTLDWDVVTGAQSYIVQYSTTPNFAAGTFVQFNISDGSTHT